MDKTVRLWHVTRLECLCVFNHSDFVTSIQFHPRDDRFFLAGSLDSKLRIWNIPDKCVAYWNQVPDMITAVAFTPDGKTAVAGCLSGLCLFYETEGLKYQTQIRAKSAYSKNARGSKITGIQTTNIPPGDATGDVKILITSNDCRTRLYNFRDKSMEMKFKGNDNASSQIHARLSEDARHVICGSEDKRVFIWSIGPIEVDKKDRRPVEMFEAHTAATTCAVLAPIKSRQLLSSSEDPLYDLCNPPPVTLISKAEVESIHSSKGATENGSIQLTPATAEGGSFKRAEESPAYVTRSAHPNGNIIITADSNGEIKVFRQDCAHEKRRQRSWDTSSVFSKKIGSGLGRNSSSATHDGRRMRKGSVTSQPPGDRILSWRQNIASTGSLDKTLGPLLRHRKGRTRSHSPPKLQDRFSSHSSRVAGTPCSDQSHSDTPSTHESPLVDTSSSVSQVSRTAVQGATLPLAQPNRSPSADHKPQYDLSTAVGRSALQRDNSYVYWGRDAWQEPVVNQLQHAEISNGLMDSQKGLADGRSMTSNSLGVPSSDRRESAVSGLSSEISSAETSGQEEDRKPGKRGAE